MNSLGIFFGPKIIAIVETKGKTLLNSGQILQSVITSGELEEKVPIEVKTVAVFKDELRKNKIEAKEASIVLSGKDLVIRTFEMAVVPPKELDNAVKYEARKYIPFRIEDLITDFQIQYDKANRKNVVLFMGIKKDTLGRYVSILNQLDIKPIAIEYSAFSILRLLKLSGFSDKGVISVVSIDFKEEDEVNFTVLEDGFPLFSRDITLGGVSEEIAGAAGKGKNSAMILEKLKTEIRVSLDYYNRKFSNKKITRTYLISSEDFRRESEVFIKELELNGQYIDVAKLLGTATPFSLSLIKGYCASLSKTKKSTLKLNLMAASEKIKKREAVVVGAEVSEIMPSLFTGLQVYPNAVILGVLICAATFVFGIINRQPLKKELSTIINMRQKIEGVNSSLSNEDLSRIEKEFKTKVKVFDDLIKGQIYVAEIMEATAKVKPDGIWINNFDFKREYDKAELSLGGMAYLTDSDKEFILVNKFLANLKESPVVSKYFKDFRIVSLDHKEFKKSTVTTFTIVCSLKGEK